MIGFLVTMLRAPEAQDDPYAWAAALVAHAFLGVAGAALLPWWMVLGAYALWEAAQWLYYGAEWRDCILDWVAVALGVCVALSLMSGEGTAAAVLALSAIALIGVRVRQ